MSGTFLSTATDDGSRRIRSLLCMLLAAVLWIDSPAAYAATPPTALAKCEGLMAERPGERESARCFHQAANAELRPEIVDRLDELRREYPEIPWLPYYLALVEWPLRTARIPGLLAEAAQALRLQGNVGGEFYARRARTRFLSLVGRMDDAAEEFRRLTKLKELTEDPELQALIRVEQARHLIFQGGDLEQALHLLLRDQALVTETDETPVDLRRAWLRQTYSALYELGRYREAKRYLEDLLAITTDPFAQASTAYRLAMLHAAGGLPNKATHDLVRKWAERALELARHSGNLSTEILARRLLGQLLKSEDGREHLEICLDLTESKIQEPGLRASCLEALAVAEAMATTPEVEKVERLLLEATRMAEEAGDPWSLLRVRQAHAKTQWALGDREAGIAESLEVLDDVEALRSAQAAESGRARVLSVWWEPYQWLAGQLLRTETGLPQREDLELAFQVTERMRARTLLETLGSHAILKPRLPAELSAEQKDLEKKRVKLQKRLAAPDIDQVERQRLNEDLATLEQRDAALRHRAAMIHSRTARDAPEVFADLDAVEATLAANEAMLSFQFGLWRDIFDRPDTGSGRHNDP